MHTRRYCLFLSVILFLFVVLPAGPAPVLAGDQGLSPEVSVLGNGLTVASRTLPSLDTVSIAVSVRAGSRDEGSSFQGGTHWLEHLIFLGSQKYPTQADLYAALDDTTGGFNGTSDHETTTFVATTTPAKFQSATGVLADMILHPAFPADDAERERQVVLTELAGTSPSSSSLEAQTLGQRLVGSVVDIPGGTPESVKKLTLADAIAFKAQYYVGQNMAVGVVGPLSHQEVMAAVSKGFADLPAGAQRVTPAVAPVDSLRLTAERGLVVVAGQRIPGLNSPDVEALLVLDAILDEPGTRMSDAMNANEDTFGGDTFIQLYSDVGFWRAHGYGPPDEVLAVVQAQLRRLQNEPVPDAELRSATRYLAGETLLNNEFTSDQATRLARLTLFGSYEPEEQEANRLLAVTASDVQRVAQTYFNPDTLSVIAPKDSRSANGGG